MIELLLEQDLKKGEKGYYSWIHLCKQWEEGAPHLLRAAQEKEGVEILTIHKSKGLEFPIVFALGLSSRTGRVDPLLEGEELSLQEIEAEKLRQLYVALTRAKKRVYIPIAWDSSCKAALLGKASPIELFCRKILGSDLFSIEPLEFSLLLQALKRLKEEEKISFSLLEEPVEEKTPFVMKKNKNLTPPPHLPSLASPTWVHSFSSLSSHRSVKRVDPSSSCLPVGKEMGVFLHEVLEKAIKEVNSYEDMVEEKAKLFGYSAFTEEIKEIVKKSLFTPIFPGKSWALCDLDPKKIWTESEFYFSSSQDLLKGVIDLIFSHEGVYYFLDWKSNYLGEEKSDYEVASLEKVMEERDYFLQAAIYTEAVKKFVAPFPSLCFGGGFYVFLRGLKWQEGIYSLPQEIEVKKWKRSTKS